MALLNIDLGSGETIIDSNNAVDGDVISLNIIDSGTLIIDGVDVTISDVVGVGAVSSPTFAAQNGGSLTVDQGLLTANLLSNPTFEIRDDGTVELDASSISLGLTETLLNRFDVAFTGDNHTGKFMYDPPAVSLLALGPQTFNVTGMAETDVFEIVGRTNLRVDAPLTGFPGTRNPEDAYENGILTLVSPALPLIGEQVNIEIPMTQEEFDLFLANPGDYLSGGSFTFPGAIVCFARGTLILTDRGEVAIEDLRVNDLVITRDHGAQAIRWIGSNRVGTVTKAIPDRFRPIRIAAGSLGENIPSQDLIVSPQHRVLVRSRIAQRMFAASEVLVAAKQLLLLDGIDVATDLAEVEYFHMLFDQHEVVISNGAESESLYTGPEALKSVGAAALEEILSLFPELKHGDTVPSAARELPSGRKARKLAMRHLQHGQPLVS